MKGLDNGTEEASDNLTMQLQAKQASDQFNVTLHATLKKISEQKIHPQALRAVRRSDLNVMISATPRLLCSAVSLQYRRHFWNQAPPCWIPILTLMFEILIGLSFNNMLFYIGASFFFRHGYRIFFFGFDFQ